MSNSQEQSLDEDAVFLPVTKSCPEFIHCERERQALERLLSAGPGVFYSCVGTERSGCFLSPEEVGQVNGWAQDYHISQLQGRGEQSAEEGSSEMEDFSDTYFPTHSDIPAPCLELGWPEKGPWMGRGCVTVHTSPPAEGQPPIREIIRRYLQGASQVIAIVTDKLTDGTVIGDLHNAASRGVPVYIILNQRSIQENFMPNRLRHPNMQVRVLGGKTFRSRMGAKVVGEMKDNFILLDLETVIHGSYSLTWTDAHLHRQLITVLSGPVVESFDQEFRVLFAASSPIPDTWKAASPPVDAPHLLKEFPDLHLPKHLPLEPVTSPTPPPPADSPLDWEALGVVQRDSPVNHHEEIVPMERPLQNKMLFDEKKTPIVDEFAHSRNRFLDQERICENTTSVTNNLRDKPTRFNSTQLPQTDSFNLTTAELQQRVEHKIERAYHRQLSKGKSANSDDRTTVRPGEKREQNSMHNMVTFSSTQRRERSKTEGILEEDINMDRNGSRVDGQSSSRRPIILRVPQSERFSSLSDIMRRLKPQQSSSAQQRTGLKTAMSDLSRSMVDLSVHNTDANQEERGVPVPRLQASCFDPGHVTPALALMRKRNDEIKSLFYRTPKTFLPSNRPRSTSFGFQMDWGGH
uniref:uncharacterized protein fam83e n=1 Tax=Centroberyx gerrardi TaxID=166262 RepID=UPI003AB0E356